MVNILIHITSVGMIVKLWNLSEVCIHNSLVSRYNCSDYVCGFPFTFYAFHMHSNVAEQSSVRDMKIPLDSWIGVDFSDVKEYCTKEQHSEVIHCLR
jgi:hypothetical protein